jgi:hypothetical protein
MRAKLEAGMAGVPPGPWETLADWAAICDDIICSSDVAALKADDPRAFSGPWLERHGLGFPDAMLIDDRADNCAAFTGRPGGPAWPPAAGWCTPRTLAAR